jgi:hypothetical protein
MLFSGTEWLQEHRRDYQEYPPHAREIRLARL